MTTLIPIAKPYFSQKVRREITGAVDDILSSGQLMLGEFTNKLESSFASYVGTSFAVTLNSCTTALQICLMHCDVTDCDVLVPSASFVTDLSVIRWAGGTPILVDIDPATLSFDIQDLKRKRTPKTKAIIWVHLTGMISRDWRDIRAFATEHNLLLIEDCAHAHGASVGNLKAGSIGDVGCFSFYPTKVMTTGTGGILTTNDVALEKAARELRLFGREDGVGSVVREGNDWFMDEIRACVGYYQLQELDATLSRRREIAGMYHRELDGLMGLTMLDIPSEHLSSWCQYPVFVDPNINYQRFAARLKDNYGIPTKPIYTPLHQETIFRDLDDGSLRQTEYALNHSLCLPLFVEMTDEQVRRVVRAVRRELEISRYGMSA